MGTERRTDRPARPNLTPCTIDRRRFLVVVSSAAAYTALRPHAAWARKAARAYPNLQTWSLSPDAPANPIDLARALIGAAVLAPSNWNSQPWRFEVDGASIRLAADIRRSLPITDPDQRALMISLGAALENLLVAARSYGLMTKVAYFPHAGSNSVVAEVSWSDGELRRDRNLFAAIPERRTNRREYDRRAIFNQSRAQLIAQIPEEFRLHWLDDRDAKRAIADLAREAIRARVADRPAEAEQYGWMRFSDGEARRRGDGVTVDALELGGPSRWLAGRYFNPRSWFLRFGIQSAGKQTRDAIRSSAALALLTTSQRSETQWVIGGQAYERLALKATELGIANQPINAPIEMEPYRTELLHRFGATGQEPLVFLRFGHAKRPKASMRRAVAVVSSFRNS
jgi:nitroreductase